MEVSKYQIPSQAQAGVYKKVRWKVTQACGNLRIFDMHPPKQTKPQSERLPGEIELHLLFTSQ